LPLAVCAKRGIDHHRIFNKDWSSTTFHIYSKSVIQNMIPAYNKLNCGRK
jgi:hypothetical protein